MHAHRSEVYISVPWLLMEVGNLISPNAGVYTVTGPASRLDWDGSLVLEKQLVTRALELMDKAAAKRAVPGFLEIDRVAGRIISPRPRVPRLTETLIFEPKGNNEGHDEADDEAVSGPMHLISSSVPL
jgi:hypothetical protein